MIVQEVTLINRLGLHARAAGKLVATASGYNADIHIRKDQKRVNAKSIMGILMLAATQGSQLTIEADGDDAKDACAALMQLIQERFGEEE